MGDKIKLKMVAMEITILVVNADYQAAAILFEEKSNHYDYAELSQIRDYIKSFSRRALNGETTQEIIESF